MHVYSHINADLSEGHRHECIEFKINTMEKQCCEDDAWHTFLQLTQLAESLLGKQSQKRCAYSILIPVSFVCIPVMIKN